MPSAWVVRTGAALDLVPLRLLSVQNSLRAYRVSFDGNDRPCL